MPPDPSFHPLPASRRRLARIVVTTFLAVCALVSLEFLFGRVSGSEFSPDRFERRSFLFYQVPWFQLQISPVVRKDKSNKLEVYLRRKMLISAPRQSRRWDVVSVRSATQTQRRYGQASVLCRYLDQLNDRGNLWWLDWSQEHPDLAKPLWEAVQQAANLEAYFFVPELFDLAMLAEDATTFSVTLDQRLAQRYAELAEDYRASGRSADAQKYAAVARQRRSQRDGSSESQAEILQKSGAFP